MGDETRPQMKYRTWTLVIDKSTEPPKYVQHFYENGALVESRELTPEEAQLEMSPGASVH